MQKVMIAAGVLLLLLLVMLIVRALKVDDEVARPTGPVPSTSRPEKGAGVQQSPSRTAAPAAPQPSEDLPPSPPQVTRASDAPPMARRVPRSQRPAPDPAPEQPQMPVAPPVTTAPPAPQAVASTISPVAAPVLHESLLPDSGVPTLSAGGPVVQPRAAGSPLPVRRRAGAEAQPPPLVTPSSTPRREHSRDPEAIRGRMSGLQAGIARGRQAATSAGPDKQQMPSTPKGQ